MMKKQLISSLILISLVLLAVGIHANISFNSSSSVPVISDGGHDEFVKYIDVVTGAETWGHRTAYVVVAAWADGVGVGQGTLASVTMLGETLANYQDTPHTVGTTNPNGSWTAGTKESVRAVIEMDVPDVKGSYPWSASGDVKLTPYVWQESVLMGGAQRPFSTSGGWRLEGNSSTTRSAASASGTHTVKFQYKCDVCQQSGDTAAAIGGKEAHSEGECPGSNCSVRYRKCTPPVGHQIHEACGTRHCDGQDHSYVGLCTSHVSSDPANTYTGCNQKIYKCTESDHRVIGGKCGHKYRACSKGDHDSLDRCPGCGKSFTKCSHGTRTTETRLSSYA